MANELRKAFQSWLLAGYSPEMPRDLAANILEGSRLVLALEAKVQALRELVDRVHGRLGLLEGKVRYLEVSRPARGLSRESRKRIPLNRGESSVDWLLRVLRQSGDDGLTTREIMHANRKIWPRVGPLRFALQRLINRGLVVIYRTRSAQGRTRIGYRSILRETPLQAEFLAGGDQCPNT
jgi:hypothetical protein